MSVESDKFNIVKRVEAIHTAKSVGSGGLEVLSTPFLGVFFEEACYKMVEPAMDAGFSTVGIKLELDHLKATLVGKEVSIQCKLVKQDGRRVDFEGTATEGGELVGRCVHSRIIIDIERFKKRL